jgi:REP element-mobilizing transposase RayT
VTPPRQIEAGTTMLITARAVGRAFRFLPIQTVVDTLFFVFAYAVSKYGVEIHEFCWMSNHVHILLTTRDTRLPAFMQLLDSLSSRALNALRNWSGANFEKNYNIVVDTDVEAILNHSAYVQANPCAAHLVVRATQWKGLTSARMDYGEEMTVKRPKLGLWADKLRDAMRSPGRRARAKQTRTPKSVTFKLVRPPIMEGASDAEVRKEVRRRVGIAEAKAEAERVATGRRVLGMNRVRDQHWNDLPLERDDLFGPEPKAAGNRWAVAEAMRRSRVFLQQYREALAAWCAGERDVEFPNGTYLMRVRYAVRCGVAPP